MAWRRRLDPQLRLHAVLGVACALGLVSISRVFGDFFDYVIRWIWVLAALVGVAIVWTAWEASPRAVAPAPRVGGGGRPRRRLRRRVGRRRSTSSRRGRATARSSPASRRELEDELDADGRYLVRWDDTISLGATGVGVLLELEKRGFDVGADPFQRAAVLPHRIVDDECDADAVVEIVVGPWRRRGARLPGAEEVAVVDTRTPEERRRFDEAAARLDDALREAGADELTPVADQQLIGIALDPRLPEDAEDDLVDARRARSARPRLRGACARVRRMILVTGTIDVDPDQRDDVHRQGPRRS